MLWMSLCARSGIGDWQDLAAGSNGAMRLLPARSAGPLVVHDQLHGASAVALLLLASPSAACLVYER
jgi:hypothetical protein